MADQAWENRTITCQVGNLPPWLDGPVIKGLAKRNGWTYEQAKAALEAYGQMPTHVDRVEETNDDLEPQELAAVRAASEGRL